MEDWLASNGVSKDQLSYSPAKDWIKASLPVDKVETLLDTKYYEYQGSDGSKLVRTPQYSLPKALHQHIELVAPTNSFVATRKIKSSFTPAMGKRDASVPSAGSKIRSIPVERSAGQISSTGAVNVSGICNATHVTPTCLRTVYGTINYTPQVPGKNKVGLTDYLEEVSTCTGNFLAILTPSVVEQ